MRLGVSLRRAAATLLVVAAATTSAMGKSPTGKLVIRDVELNQAGALVGRLVDQAGRARAQQTVAISHRGQVIAHARTDDGGFFAAPVKKGGVYVVQVGNTVSMLRAWAAKTAPPSAAKGALLVSNATVSRLPSPANVVSRGQAPVGLGALGGLSNAATIATSIASGAVSGFVVMEMMDKS